MVPEDPADFIKAFPKISMVAQEFGELTSWFLLPMTVEEWKATADNLAQFLLAKGTSFRDTREFVERMSRRLPGAPRKRRIVAVQALEMRRCQPRKSWMQVAIACCNCNKIKHDERCKQVLRQEVMALERVLKRYGIHCEANPD
jgi:hypothetical protein